MNWKGVTLAIASAIVGALIAVAVLRGGAKDTDDEEKQPARPDRVSVAGTDTAVSLDAETAGKSGVTVAPLEAGTRTESSRAFATALDVRDLVDAKNQLSVSRAQTSQARARLAAAVAELARVKALHDDNRNVSDRVLQEAAANVDVERANAEAANAAAQAAAGGVRVRWGSTVADAFVAGASWIDALVANRSVLLQVVAAVQPPRTIAVSTADGTVRASYVSPSPRSDPRVQGRSWLYLAPAGAIVPGTTASVDLAAGAAARGAVVPSDAVVWTEGKAWVYVEHPAGRYVRTAIDTSSAASGGYFVTTLTPGTRVVVAGAQQLLSEESKPSVEE